MFNPAKTAEEIKKAYIGYISTTFHFRRHDLQERLVAELYKTVSKGPFVEIKDSFKSGKCIDELIEDGILSPLYRQLEKDKPYKAKLPLHRPLYFHQEVAVRKITAGKNVVVSTGTGSGKTNCFLIPIINELLREKENGTLNDGVRAIFIYPMNALANDQIKGLREILMAYPDIRFGVYNGGTQDDETAAIRLYKSMFENEKHPELRNPLPNEEISRDMMKKHPPHILFTNYAMLEYMLFRPGDDNIFSNSKFKFVVLDEAHVYTGATGIETSFLMGRLKGRINDGASPQFILTSATLGDGTPSGNEKVAEFAERLTGCHFDTDDIVNGFRDKSIKSDCVKEYPVQLFADLYDEHNFFDEVLSKYDIDISYAQEREPEILYDIISSSALYHKMRKVGHLVRLDELAKTLDITQYEVVTFIALCAKARREDKPLVDIRYHFFLKALDGCYLALDHPQSLSMIRQDQYQVSFGKYEKMFEIAVCDDCGEIAIVGKIENGKLVRANDSDERIFFQVHFCDDAYESESDSTGESGYFLCKKCGAIIAADEVHNKWCTCDDTSKIKLTRLTKDKCLNCDGTLRQFKLGYDAATGVLATALYEQIPEYTFVKEEDSPHQNSANIFFQGTERNKKQVATGSQFLIFSDSRQGAAKFACFLEEMYKQFLRRRGIWKVIGENEQKYSKGLTVSDFVGLLQNYFSTTQLFRTSNFIRDADSAIANDKNAWIAVLDELYNCNRDTSLVSLGMMSFEYLGNSQRIVDVVAQNYHISHNDAKNYLEYLMSEIVRTGAILPDSASDIHDEDREYLFFTPHQKVVTKTKNDVFNSSPFLPTIRRLVSGKKTYYHSNKLLTTKRILKVDDDGAMNFLGQYWQYLTSDVGGNEYRLQSTAGGGYLLPAKYFRVHFGKNAVLWKCKKCGKVTQYNMGGTCNHNGCCGELERIDSVKMASNNYYAKLYECGKITPLFVKEHTAQLAKNDALDYQQQFIRKEINALSCSTTFEMGVDVGDLETVFLRNIPPLASNYAQRVGRAGRSIDAAAFALTYARLSSHDFTFFDKPENMINGRIYPPNFSLDNEKILKRHVYAIALSAFLNSHSDMYDHNSAKAFINEKGYKDFIKWLESKPETLTVLIRKSLPDVNLALRQKYVDSYEWLNDFCGENGIFTRLINEFEANVSYLKKECDKARKEQDDRSLIALNNRLRKYENNELIDFLVRGNILPKYGFPVDSVELTQNIASDNLKSLNLSRDLAVAIAEYAPSSEIVADGRLYTSRYIRKPVVNHSEMNDFDICYLATCPDCGNVNFSEMPIGKNGWECVVCGKKLQKLHFHPSIEPRSGFITEEEVKKVPLHAQERKYKTEAIYIGDKNAKVIDQFDYDVNGIGIHISSTTNDSLVVKSTNEFYVCSKCGYSIASDESVLLRDYSDYRPGAVFLEDAKRRHRHPFGKGLCTSTSLRKYGLHHEFKTDVAKIIFDCNTNDYPTMLSVMYAILNAFSQELDIERRDIKGCLTYKVRDGRMEHCIIIYDSVPGGAGHSRRIVTEDGAILRNVIQRAYDTLRTCQCEPSCYRCLRSYENQRVHEILNRDKALEFLKSFIKE